MKKEVVVGKIKIGGSNPLVLIAGPCVIEDKAKAIEHAKALKMITERFKIPFIFKASYDKANRSSVRSFRGPGLKEGLEILSEIKTTLNIPVTSDVHTKEEARQASRVLDLVQIPALLSRQTDLLLEAARTGKPVNIKKGQFMAPWDMRNVVEKIESCGNENIILTERGTSFGYNNLVSDMRSIVIMKEMGCPVVFDASHSVQLPAGEGERSGGERKFIPYLCRSAVSAGADGLFLEVHKDPDSAPCDGANMWPIDKLADILEEVLAIKKVLKRK